MILMMTVMVIMLMINCFCETASERKCAKSSVRKTCSYWEFFFGLYFPAVGLNTERYSVFSSTAGKYGPEKLRIRTLFMQYKFSAETMFRGSKHRELQTHQQVLNQNPRSNLFEKSCVVVIPSTLLYKKQLGVRGVKQSFTIFGKNSILNV